MRLLRNGELVAEGKAKRDPDDDVVLFRVQTWHVQEADVDAWGDGPATWVLDDGKRRTVYEGRGRAGVGVASGGVVRTLDVTCRDALGDDISLDVR